ncbi:tetratricopeptide repeat protein [Neorhodopirellula pilleata]|uniref:tetratricopeptide repeat protein n=1 Tax=Neorhodopirellula pilleata TaxID=2714738 RepID=UPI0011B368B3|nr:hypothetical protein [Neorhodopirellula pilleata]
MGKQAAEASRAQIAELIEGLASDSYATRIRCRDRLSRIGLAAFDQLREAREHPDSEVAIVARRLTSGLQVQWSVPDDSSTVRELLFEYSSLSITERQDRITQLAELPRGESFEPLLRLARFEPEPGLARSAALAIMNQDTTDGSNRADEAHSIQSKIKDPELIANAWLLQYAKDLQNGSISPKQWQVLFDEHRQVAVHGDTGANDTARQLLQLVWITAERAIDQGSPDAALEIVRNNVGLIPARTRDLIQATSWALDHSLYPSIAAMYEANLDLFEKSPILLYSAAEAYSRMEQASVADRLAGLALEINPIPMLVEQPGDPALPNNADQAEPFIHPQVIRLHAEAHVKIAFELSQRGLFRWAEKEFQLVIDRLPLDHTMAARARLYAAEMHSELQHHEVVIEMLTPLDQRIERDNEFEERLIADQFSSAIVRSNLDFHRGLLLIQRGQAEQAQPVLKRAFETNRENIDILIAMYRLEGDQKWQDEVRKTLTEQIGIAEAEVNEAVNTPRRLVPPWLSENSVAKRLNAYAWLVSNTEGDYQKALKYSRESLRLTPNQPALMDTCARCYFAVGDLEAAVKMQAEACERMPHSPPLQRQLEQFEQALKSSRSSEPPQSP